MMYEKRLHPAAILFQFIRSLKDMAFGLLPILILSFNGGRTWYILLGAIVLATGLGFLSVVKWMRFSYSVTNDALQIKQGIFIRKERYISKSRIQSIDLTQSVIHRLLGLTKVQIETAGSDENVDASLSAVTFEDGTKIQEELNSRVREGEEENGERSYPSETTGYGKLALAGATSDNAILIIGLLWLVFSQANQLIPEQAYEEATAWVLSLALQILIPIVILLFLFLWGAGIIWTVVKYGKFSITRYEEELYMTYGLLEKRQRTIPVNRIQAVLVKENMIRQLFGLCYVYVEVAGGINGGRMEGSTVYLSPIVRKKEVEGFLDRYLPEYSRKEPSFTHPPVSAVPYYILKGVLAAAAVCSAVYFFASTWFVISLFSLPLFIGWGLFRWKTAGIAYDGSYIHLRFRKISRETVTMKTRRIQACTKKENWLFEKQYLATIDVAILNNTAGRHFIVPALAESDVTGASAQFSRVSHIHTREDER